MTLDAFVAAQTQSLALFAANWRLHTEANAASPEGAFVWPTDLEAGQWDMEYASFDVLDAAIAGLFVVDTPQGFVVRTEQDCATDS
jgi:hypothetical protein